MIKELRNLIKRYKVTLAKEDTTGYPLTQVSFNGKTVDIEYLYPYGSHGVPPNESIGVGFNILAYEENKVGIFYNADMRPKGLKPGEYAAGNFSIDSLMKFLETGEISITSSNGSKVVISEGGAITLSGKAGAIIELDDVGDVNITAPTTTVNGELVVTGGVAVGGGINVTGASALTGGASLGSGGAAIARVGDAVQVTNVQSGSSTRTGTITSGSSNNTSD